MKSGADPAIVSNGWTRRREKLSRQIEEATLRSILERGIDHITVEEIARAADISRRTFYRYFGSPLAVLAALPRRSLDRLIRDFRKRPLDESIAKAFVNALREADISPPEAEIRRLSGEVLRRWPDAWKNALGGMQAESVRRFSEVIADRLVATGRDAWAAGAVAATLAAVLTQVNTEHRHTGPFQVPFETYDAALAAVGDILVGNEVGTVRQSI